MFTWASPLWLFALIVIPLVRLLHQLHIHETAISVSSLLFWKTSAIAPQSFWRGARADPIWMLRALIAALIVLALAGPAMLNDDQHVIQIWFDDAYSLQAKEKGSNQSRLTLAVNAMIEKLENLDSVQAKVYSLRNPGYAPLLLDTQTKAAWRDQLSKWIKIQSTPASAPLTGQFNANMESWLVTDGADPQLKQSIDYLPFHQVIRVGNATENSAVTLLAVRPNWQDLNRWQGIIRVNHFGQSDSERTIELWSGKQKLEQWQLRLAPGQSQDIDFVIDYRHTRPFPVIVHLMPADSLEQDNELSLNLPAPIATKVYGTCPPPLIAAIHAHPFLQTEIPDIANSGLNIVCGDSVVDESVATIRFHQASRLQKLEAVTSWSSSAGALRDLLLPQQVLRQVQSWANSATGIPILRSGSIPLITLAETSSRVLDCYIDMSSESFAKQTEYPVLFAGLVDLVLNQSLLNPIVTITRDSDASRVKPLPLKLDVNSVESLQLAAPDCVPYLILFAILLLLFDGVLERVRSPLIGRS